MASSIRIPRFQSNCPSISTTALPPPLNGDRSVLLWVERGPPLSSSFLCRWAVWPGPGWTWASVTWVHGNSSCRQCTWELRRGLTPKPAPGNYINAKSGYFFTVRSGPLYTLERLHIISVAFVTSSVLCCAHPSRAQSVSSTPFAGGTHHLGQGGALLRARSELAAHLPGTTVPAHGSRVTFSQDSEPARLPVSPQDWVETHFTIIWNAFHIACVNTHANTCIF